MAELLSIHKALADETRLRLVRLLARGSLNVNELIEILRMGQSRVSRHLRILAEVGLVTRRREGTWIYYDIAAAPREPLVDGTLGLLAEHERQLPHFELDLQRMEAAIERRRQQTRRFFDSRQDGDELRHRSLDGAFYRQVALSLLPEHCDTIVDLGTGSGLLLPALLERADDVIAVDASMTMLELARTAAAEGAHRCDFRLGDLEHLPVADGEADAVMACMVLHHVSTPSRALAEAWRALRAGGTLVVVDLARHADESLRELADLWLGFESAEVAHWLQEAGFRQTRADTMTPEGADQDMMALITFQASKPGARRPRASGRSGGARAKQKVKPATARA